MPPIYHITSVDNLPGIIKAGGLLCDRDAKNIQFVSIAHKRIKERRLKKKVPIGAGGVLADYVPFYFAPRSPMLFTINKGNVEGYARGQQPIVHFSFVHGSGGRRRVGLGFYRRPRCHGLYGLLR